MLPDNLEQNKAIKILYIEDDVSFSDLVRIYLEQESYSVYSFIAKETLKEGLEVLENDENVSVILLDLNLPDSRGLDTLATVHKRFPNQNIIVLTGQDDERIGVSAVQSGAQDYLVKGAFDNKGLVKSIRYALERSAIANRLAEAQRIAKIGNWISIPENNYFFLSPVSYRLFGLDYAKEDFSIEEIRQPDHPFYPLLELEDEVVNRRKLRKEVPIKLPNGVTRFLNVLCELSISPSGQYIFNGVLQDITQQKRSEEMRKARDDARQDTKFREKVFAELSREISNPIRGILATSLLFEEDALSKEQKAFVHSIRESAQFLNKTVTQFIEQGLFNKPTPQKEQFFLQEVLEVLQDTFGSIMEQKGGRLEVQLSDRINWAVFLPKNLFKQVLFVLVKQACSQAEKEVSIKVDLVEERGKTAKIQLLISDDGAIISSKKSPGHLIFEDTSKPELGVAKAVLESIGGHIGYYTNASRKEGNVFFMELVVEKGKKTEKTTDGTKKPDAAQREGELNLLVIEPNPMNQLLLKSTIEEQLSAACIFMAANAKQALSIAKKEKIQLVLLDMEGEKKDVFDITSFFAEQQDNVPVIALSAVDYSNHQNDLKNYGLDDFILKPYDPDLLIEKITFYANVMG